MNKPKAAPAAGVFLLVLSVLLVAGVATFAGPCAHDPAGSCLWASRAVLGAGAVLIVLSIVRVFETDEGERRGLSLGSALVGAFVAAVPSGFIALCSDPSMQCNAVMRPFVMCVGAAIFLVGAVDLARRLLAIRRR